MTLFPLDGKDLFYRIEEWSDDGRKPVRVLAAACNYAIASKAFDGAVREYSNRRITMREGIKVNREHVPEALRVNIPAPDLMKDFGIVEPVKYVHAVRRMVRVRSAAGVKVFGPVELHQLVVALRKNGHDATADLFAPAIDAAVNGARNV